MKRIRVKPSFSNVVSLLALFVALGGSAYAAANLPKNSVGTKQLKANAVTAAKIKNGAVTGAKIKLTSLGTVPTATHATSADSAAKAANADSLGGTAASGFAKNQLEALHVIGAAGQPPFLGGCDPDGFFQDPAFYKDPFGVVHLLGDLSGCTENNDIFLLPPGFRPPDSERFVIRKGDNTTGTIRVEASGEVAIFLAKEGSLTGIQFRTN